MKIALDLMGGDFAPEANVGGLKQALAKLRGIERYVLVGDLERMQAALRSQGLDPALPQLELVHASQVVGMHEPATVAIRQKKDSSITVAAELMKQGRVDAVVSAGHTGAAVSATVVKNRLLPGVDRPGIATLMPTLNGLSIVLDVGANVDAKPLHLAQYALMGEVCARCLLRVEQPRVGLLNVGEEDDKGSETVKDSMRLLKQMREQGQLQFVGNVEGKQLFNGIADVVVCDGFAGNLVLKCCESLAKATTKMLKARLAANPLRLAGAFLARGAFSELKEVLDHEQYGGAPLLGIDGICIIAHGSSSPKAIYNALRVGKEMVEQDMNRHIQERIAQIDWKSLLKSLEEEDPSKRRESTQPA